MAAFGELTENPDEFPSVFGEFAQQLEKSYGADLHRLRAVQHGASPETALYDCATVPLPHCTALPGTAALGLLCLGNT